MGTWGVGLFSDDTAADVRGSFRDLIGDGLSADAATDRLVAEFCPSPDPDTAPVFWLALAVTQWKAGRLLERVKREALRVIADGTDLARWSDDPKAHRQRRAILSDVALQLEAPQPTAKNIPKRFRQECDWTRGELIVYRLNSGADAHLRVAGYNVDAGGVAPVCEVVSIARGTPLDEATVAAAPLKHFLGATEAAPPSLFMLGARRKSDIPVDRLTRTHLVTKPAQVCQDRLSHPDALALSCSFVVWLWRDLDRELRRFFGII
jgi:hypothetical protein